MYPRLGGIENLDGMMLYSPILALASLVMVWMIARLLRDRGVTFLGLVPITIALALGGFGGAKLYSIVFHGSIGSLEQELAGGWRYPGSLLGMLATAWLARGLLPRGLSVGAYLDAWAPAFAVAGGIGRIGCVLHGCCYGAITSLPWAMQYPYGSIPWYAHHDAHALAAGQTLSAPVHPFPVYLLVLEFALAALLVRFRPQARYSGQVVLLFLAIHGISKGLLEAFRAPFSWMHVIVLPIGLVALGLLWRNRDRAREGHGRRPLEASAAHA